MTPPNPNQIWFWAVKGFEGLFSLLEKWVSQGVPTTPELKQGLENVRDRLNQLISRLP
jgi:hypothetical protein